MKVWKSPVFYFGVFLVLVVASALLAPFVMDWGRYRIGLEAYGEKLTGRKVEITGPITVRLFPWPRLVADDVQIANPEGASEKWFATADQVSVQMTLGALLNGVIQVESIDVRKPVVKLRRSLDGRNNWNFSPAETIRNSPLLEHVMLDQITLIEGSVQLIDERRGEPVHLADLNGTFSAPNLAGPWRMAGTFGYDDLPLAFSASTGAFTTGAPLHVGLRVSAQENLGYSYFLDGDIDAAKFKGSVRLAPIVDPEGKGDTEGQVRPITFKASVAGDFDKIDLSEIEIRPADVGDQGTLLAGDASFSLGQKISITSNLTAPRVDFDTLAGAGSRRLLRDGGGLSLVNGLLTMLPEDVELRSSLKIAALKAGGETLENALLDVSANREAVRIHELSASLPGRSRSRFEGVFFPGAQYAELAGNLAVESADARALSMWLWPENKTHIATTWSGNRGQLKAKADVTLTASKLEFANIQYELNGDPGTANFKVLVNGERPIVDLHIDTPVADIDSFVATGLAAVSSPTGTSWLQLLGSFVEEQVKRDLKLTLKAGTLRLNGVEASDVAIDVETTVRGFDLKILEIGSVDGAKLSAAGVVLSTPEGPDGEIAITAIADDPRGLLRLAGILPRERDPAWATALGKTDLKIGLRAKPSTTEPATGFSVNGRMGEFSIISDGSIIPALDIARTAINGSAEITATSSAAMANLYGASIETPDSIPAKLIITADGNFSDSFLVDVTTNLYRSDVHFAGKLNPIAHAFGLNGDITLQSGNSKELLAALQLPLPVVLEDALSLGGTMNTTDTKISFGEIDGKFGDVVFAGQLALDANDRLSGDFSVDRVSLAGLLAPAFLPWNGRPSSLEQTFAKQLPLGLTGEVWVRPKILSVYPGLEVGDAEIGLTATRDRTQVAVHAKSATGEKVVVDLAATPAAGGHELAGHFIVPVDLAKYLTLNDGSAVVSGAAGVDVQFVAKGLSPAGAMATLNAEGKYSIVDARLLNVSPENFSKLVTNAKDASALQVAFAALHHGEGVRLGSISGGISIVDGVAKFTPFATKSDDADVLIRSSVELATDEFELNILLQLKGLADLPGMEITYAGQPSQLVATEDATALNSFLGFKVLEKGVGDLEKLQAEQQRLAIEEEKLRKEDEEKLAAFYAQKAELRLRMRELRVQAAQRDLDAELAAAEQARLIQEGVAMNKLEIRQRLRELKTYRKAEIFVPAVKPKPKPAESIAGPVLLVPLGSEH
jgi:uncharacterized protein involved in outer membrane biogenesis